MTAVWRLLYGGSEGAADYAYRQVSRGQLPSFKQWSLLPRLLSKKEQRTVIALIALTTITLLLMTWRWYDRNTAVVPKSGGEYSEAIVGQPVTANPLLVSNEADMTISQLTYRGLFRPDGQGNIVPDLAERYSISDDLKTYSITLRPNLTWSNGTPLTTNDVVFTIQAIQNPKLASTKAASLRDVVVEKKDDRTVNFILKEPYLMLPYALTFGIVPAHVWQSIPLDRWLQADANLRPVGSGPFSFRSLTRDGQGIIRSYTLEPNPYTHTAAPYLKKITLRFYPDYVTALDALKQDLVDGVGGTAHTALTNLNSKRFVNHELILPQYTAVFYNTRNNALLKEKAIRTGLTYAINRTTLIQDALDGGAKPATGPFTYGTLKQKIASSGITYDPTKTVQLFENAGFKRATPESPFVKGDTKLEFTLTVPNHDDLLSVAAALKRQWETAGVMVSIDVVPAESLGETIRNHTYQALLATEIMGLDPDPYSFWHSSQAETGLNLALFQSRDADDLLSQARRERDETVQQELYGKFQQIINDFQPATFLYSNTYSYTLGRDISGLTAEIIGSPADRFTNIELWYRSTERGWKN